MSYALDVHRLAQEGRRVFVVLVGEDSLEANVGHLAALTGGDIHFSFGADVGGALHAALQGLRTKRMGKEQGTPAGEQLPESVCAIRGNVRMSATWSGKPATTASGRDTLSEPVAAYAANLALTSLSESMGPQTGRRGGPRHTSHQSRTGGRGGPRKDCP